MLNQKTKQRPADKPFQASPPEDNRLTCFPSGNQLPVPQVSTQQTEDQVTDWKRVGPRRADGASALLQILSKRRDNKTGHKG